MRNLALCGALALVLPAAAVAEDPASPGKQFTAIFKFSGPQGNRQIGATILVDRYTPLDQAHQLKDVLKSQGQAGLANALRGRSNGRLNLGGLEYSLDLIVAKPIDDGFQLVVVTTRPIKYQETQDGSESLDYPLGVVSIKLDGFGRGEGRFFPTAALRINEDGSLSVDQFAKGEGRVTDVKKVR